VLLVHEHILEIVSLLGNVQGAREQGDGARFMVLRDFLPDG